MGTYIAMLRGINVSGKNMIKMPALVSLMETTGFKNVKNYLQSGNLVFDSERQELAELESDINMGIEKNFSLDIPVLVLSIDAIFEARNANPFLKAESLDETKLHVTFLAKMPEKAGIDKIEVAKYEPDTFIVTGKVIYLYCPGGYGNTKLTNNFFESKLKVTATTRNWNTINKLVEMGGK